MKVLHIVSGNLSEGAARGAYWLHCGLKELKIDSKIYTNSNINLGDNDVISISQSKIDRIFVFLRSQIDNLITSFYPKRKKMIFSTGIFGVDFTKTKEYKDADIIHLHWINNGFVNIKDLSKIDKPLVWTMRDMWPMTGGCHVAESFSCTNYKIGCGNCKQLDSSMSYDLSKFVLNRKKKYIPNHIKIVGISNWLSAKARESELFNTFDIRTISNNINAKEFFPINKNLAREIIGINTTKKIILCGATSLNDPWKGFQKYLTALEYLNKEKYFLCFFGNLEEKLVEGLGFEYKSLGFLHDNISLRLVYNCADIFVAPSLMDSFGKTLAESMACATPVACFDATGPKDIVEHKKNGYKAKPFESKDLAEGIEWIINNKNYDELSINSIQRVLNTFESQIIAKQYISLYQGVINE